MRRRQLAGAVCLSACTNRNPGRQHSTVAQPRAVNEADAAVAIWMNSAGVIRGEGVHVHAVGAIPAVAHAARVAVPGRALAILVYPAWVGRGRGEPNHRRDVGNAAAPQGWRARALRQCLGRPVWPGGRTPDVRHGLLLGVTAPVAAKEVVVVRLASACGRVALGARGTEVRDGLGWVVAAGAPRRSARGGGRLVAADRRLFAEESPARLGVRQPPEVSSGEAGLEDEPGNRHDPRHRSPRWTCKRLPPAPAQAPPFRCPDF